MADTHTVMPKKLAQALMDAGMQHFDSGGLIGGLSNALGTSNNFDAASAGDTSAQVQQQYGQQQDVYGQQQALASQLLAQTQGQGPGQQLIAQQQGQNAAQQAAVMNSARGASANPALVARQAAMMGAQGQQQALNSQAALQLQSQGALGQQYSQMANQSLQGQSIGQGAIAAKNNIGAQVAGQNAQSNSNLLGGLIGGAAALFHDGGEVKKMAAGGPVPLMGIQQYGSAAQLPMGGPTSGQNQNGFGMGQMAGKGLSSIFSGSGQQSDQDAQQGYNQADSTLGLSGLSVAPGMQNMPGVNPEMMLPAAGPSMMDAGMMAAAHGGQIPFRQMLAGGGVKGKASVKGDSEKNDTVPTMLSPGEVVLPRSVTESENAPEKAAEFIRHLKSKKKGGYSKVAESRKAK